MTQKSPSHQAKKQKAQGAKTPRACRAVAFMLPGPSQSLPLTGDYWSSQTFCGSPLVEIYRHLIGEASLSSKYSVSC